MPPEADVLAARPEALGFALATAPAATARALLAKLAAVDDRLEFAAWLAPEFGAGDAEEAIRASLARDLRRLAEANADPLG